MHKFKFKGFDVYLELKTYYTNNIFVSLIDPDSTQGSLVAVASVNLPGLGITEVAIKDWSENEGMYQTLLNEGLITPAHRYESSGWIESIPICYLTDKAVQS